MANKSVNSTIFENEENLDYSMNHLRKGTQQDELDDEI